MPRALAEKGFGRIPCDPRESRGWIDNPLSASTPRNAREIGRTVRDSLCAGAQEVGTGGWCGDCAGSTP